MTLESIKEKLWQIPPDFEAIRNAELSPAEATQLGYEYTEKCWYEDLERAGSEDSSCDDFLGWYNQLPVIELGRHSTHLYDVMEYLLQYGLDPNYTKEGNWSLLEQICHITNGYVAADTLRLLLEHGGDPNLPTDDGTVFDNIDFDIGFDAIELYDRRSYDSLVHCWMILIGYGGTPSNGTTPLDTFKERGIDNSRKFDLSNLKNHQNYIFGLSTIENRGDVPTIHIFDKRSYWEVARL